MAQLTWQDVQDKLENLGFEVKGYESNGNLYQIDIQKDYDYGAIEKKFTLQCEKDNPSSITEALKDIYYDFDVDKQALLYGKENDRSNISKIIKKMEQIKNDLNYSTQKMAFYVQNSEQKMTTQQIKDQFFTIYEGRYGQQYSGDIFLASKQVMQEIIDEYPGTIAHKKEMLTQFFDSIGFKPNEVELSRKAINNELKVRNLIKKQINTVTKQLPEQDKKIHKMFDFLFNQSDTNPIEYADYVIAAGNQATENGLTGDKWWQKAVNHAVNSGGQMWQPTAEIIELFEKFKLIEESPYEKKLKKDCYDQYVNYMKQYGTPEATCNYSEFREQIFSCKPEMIEILQLNEKLLEKYKNLEGRKEQEYEKLSEVADNKFGFFMYKYLKNLDVLDNEKRDKSIKNHKQWLQKYNKPHQKEIQGR